MSRFESGVQRAQAVGPGCLTTYGAGGRRVAPPHHASRGVEEALFAQMAERGRLQACAPRVGAFALPAVPCTWCFRRSEAFTCSIHPSWAGGILHSPTSMRLGWHPQRGFVPISLKTPRQYLNQVAMKTLILVKCFCLRYVLRRFPCLVPAFPLHKKFQPSAIRLSVVTNLFNIPLFRVRIVYRWGSGSIASPPTPVRGTGLELGVIPCLNSWGRASWKLLGDCKPRQSLFLQLADLCIFLRRVSRSS